MNQTLQQRFTDTFGEPAVVVAHAPGRVNLIGEHTDYNDGWVLPAALNIGTLVFARPRRDGILRTCTLHRSRIDQARIVDLRPREGPAWTRYVRGTAALLLQAGCAMSGADLLIASELPLGSGLSSSAALELGVGMALATLFGYTIDPLALAQLGQRVENDIIGVQSGIMDQLAVACGVADHALLIDCRTLQVEPVALPADVRLLILDSAVPRALAGSAYNQRRAECESALRKLQVGRPQLKALRDVTPELLQTEGERLSQTEVRRTRHVVSENQRVLDSAAALRHGDVATFGRLMVASHTSLRDDYAVSGPELDLLVQIALKQPGVLGARLTGAGFGGCVVALIVADQAEAAATIIPEAYAEATGRAGRAYTCVASTGAAAQWIDAQ